MTKPRSEPTPPDFCLTDTKSNMVCLSDYQGQKHVVLVFTRGFM
jgi:peroxiredoxin